jgi:hypothetical protein
MAQVADKDAGDDEAMHYDADFVRAWNTACRQRPVKASASTAW